MTPATSPCSRSSATPLDRLSCVWTVILLTDFILSGSECSHREANPVSETGGERSLNVCGRKSPQFRLLRLNVLPQTPQDVTAELCIHSLVLGNESMMHNKINVEKKMQRILLSFLNLMCCLWTWKLWTLTTNCLVIAKDSALITNDDHARNLDQFKVKVDVVLCTNLRSMVKSHSESGQNGGKKKTC